MYSKTRLISGKVPVTNTSNVTLDRYQFLDLTSAEPSLGVANGQGYILTYDSTKPGGRSWIQMPEDIDQYARNTANVASANTIYTQGVDVTQNTRINAAYAAANVGNTFVSSGGTVTGNVTITGSLTVSEGLVLEGNTTYTNVTSLQIENPIIFLANNNTLGDTFDIGFVGLYNNGANSYTGLFRDPNLDEYFLFRDYTQPIQANTLININDASFIKANLIAGYIKSNLISDSATVGGVNILDFLNIVSSNTIYTQGVDNAQNTRIDSAYVAANVGNNFVNNGGVVSGDVTITQDLTISGNLTVLGTEITLNTASIDIDASLLLLANNNTLGDALDVGFVGTYNDGQVRRAGLFRDPNVKEFLFFDGYTPGVTSNSLIDIEHDSFSRANIQADYFKGNLIATSAVVNGINLTDKLNTLTANDIYTQGVDNWQNTRITSVDSFTQSSFNKANSANSLAQAAFNAANSAISFSGVDQLARDTANSASSNTIYTQGVDTTQNTRITAVDSFAGGAYNKANSAYNLAEATNILTDKLADVNLTQNTYIQAAFDKANSANILAQSAYHKANNAAEDITLIQGVNVYQNTRITAVDSFAQAAFNKANTGGEYAIDNVARLTANSASSNTIYTQGVDVTQNTRISAVDAFAQAAFNVANSASSTLDQYARDTANSASSNTIYTQGVDTWQNTRITSIDSFAEESFNKANSANVLAQAAFDKANSANVLAQASFNTANTKLNLTGGTLSGDLTVTGNLFVSGNTTTYTSNNVVINDPIILLANNNTGNALDVGFVAHYIENATLKHTGLVKDVSTNTWYLLDNYTPEIQGSNLLDPNHASLRISTLKANLISNSVFINGYDVLSYTQSAFDKANTSAIDQYARDTANSASSNTIVIQGVNLSQNTNITNIDTKAQAAFDKANTTPIDQIARNTANSASSNTIYTQGVDNTQNTNITNVDTKAQAAFDKANTSSGIDQVARNTANSASSNTIVIQGVDLWQNTRMSAIESYAQSAYSTANSASGGGGGGGGGVVSLSGFAANNVLTVNSAGYIANNANLNYYTSNNTLVVTGNVIGGGIRSTTSTSAPTNPVVGDIWYKTGTDVIYRWTYDGNSYYWIDISGTPVAVYNPSANISGVSLSTTSFIGDGNTSIFTLPFTPVNETYTMVAVEGVIQFKDTYSVAGNTIIFTSPPDNGYNFEVTIFNPEQTSGISTGKAIAMAMIFG